MDEEWVEVIEKTFPITGHLVASNTAFSPALKKAHEILIHHSIGKKTPWAMPILGLASPAKNPSSHWAFRLEREAVRKDADALVLCARSKDAAKALKKKTKVQKKLKELREQSRTAADEDKKAKINKKIQKKMKQAKPHRGLPVDLCDFAKRIEILA